MPDRTDMNNISPHDTVHTAETLKPVKNVVYIYDGSFEGLLSCVFESFEKKEQPEGIATPEQAQLTMFEQREICTDAVKAQRVRSGIQKKISPAALDFIWRAYLTNIESVRILEFIRLGFSKGKNVMNMLTHEKVSPLSKAVIHLGREAENYLGFVRFSQSQDFLWSVIEPKNRVLYIIDSHFADRFQREKLIIYDKTHGEALFCHGGQWVITAVSDFSRPPLGEEDRLYQGLWKRFYKTIGIEERRNERGRMSHMPKRYWGNMAEHDLDTLSPAPREGSGGERLLNKGRD